MINIIAAVGAYVPGKGCPIGKGGKMPWHNSADLKWFKETTMGHPVIMGRKTWESIGGKPLEGRTNIIVSKTNELYFDKNVYRFDTVESAIEFAKVLDKEEVFIIGGATIFQYALDHNLVDNIYLDYLAEFVEDADTFFPDIRGWKDDGCPIEVEKSKAYAVKYHRETGNNNHVDDQYLSLVNEIIEHGHEKDTRAGKTLSLFGKQLRFNLQEGLPMLTTKKMFSRGVIHELLWFLKGDTNIKYLVDNGVHIWDDDAYRYYLEVVKKHNDTCIKTTRMGWKSYERQPIISVSKEEFMEKVKNGEKMWVIVDENAYIMSYTPNTWSYEYQFGDLNRVYGAQWTNWGGHNQIHEVIEILKTNPDDRRMIISAWNVGDIPDMALPPCHYCCQFYTTKLTEKERFEWAYNHFSHEDEELIFNYHTSNDSNYIPNSLAPYLDRKNVPTRKLSCMFHMRSNDIGAGTPFNWASYAILTHMIAQCVNMDVDELIYEVGDAHIYENHIELLKEQLKRNPHMYALPKLVLNPDIKNIEDFTYDDIKIEDYQSYPAIKLPLNVGL